MALAAFRRVVEDSKHPWAPPINQIIDGILGNRSLTFPFGGSIQLASGARIFGDFSNATHASRTLFQSSTTNGVTEVGAIPNGSGTTGAFNAYNNSAPASGTVGRLRATSAAVQVVSEALGGSALPMEFVVAGSTRMTMDTSGRLGINTTGSGARLAVVGDSQFLSGAAGTILLFQFGRTAIECSLAIPGSAGQYAADAAVGDVVLRSESQKVLIGAGGTNSSVACGISGGQPTLSHYGGTLVTRPSAYTQTYSTASKTVSNLTSATLTIGAGTANTTTQDVTAAYSQVILNDNFADLATQINALRVDLVVVKNNVTSIIDDLQSVNLVG